MSCFADSRVRCEPLVFRRRYVVSGGSTKTLGANGDAVGFGLWGKYPYIRVVIILCSLKSDILEPLACKGM